MIFSSSFWAMDGYAGFVWPSYIIVFAVIAGLLGWSLIQSKSLKKKLNLLEQLNEKKK